MLEDKVAYNELCDQHARLDAVAEHMITMFERQSKSEVAAGDARPDPPPGLR